MDKKQSKLLSNRIDVKNYTISMFANEIEASNQASPVFLTHFGKIKGELVNSHRNNVQADQHNIIDSIFVPVMQKRNDTISEWEQEVGQEAHLIHDCQFMMLKNVTLTPFSNPLNEMKLDELILFSDQIIGITAETK